jgi:hypothetical protein
MQYDILYCICLPCSHAVNISYKHNQQNTRCFPLAATIYFILLLHFSTYTVIFIVNTEHDTRSYSNLPFVLGIYYNISFYNICHVRFIFLILENFQPAFLSPYINHV